MRWSRSLPCLARWNRYSSCTLWTRPWCNARRSRWPCGLSQPSPRPSYGATGCGCSTRSTRRSRAPCRTTAGAGRRPRGPARCSEPPSRTSCTLSTWTRSTRSSGSTGTSSASPPLSRPGSPTRWWSTAMCPRRRRPGTPSTDSASTPTRASCRSSSRGSRSWTSRPTIRRTTTTRWPRTTPRSAAASRASRPSRWPRVAPSVPPLWAWVVWAFP
mmetsp:Transcript_35860/g.107796  ORF Transcript_35860/g.107796 Transcript_35860/m.107796 type:complete len:215 (-) Transcript_35860:239-883(-)